MSLTTSTTAPAANYAAHVNDPLGSYDREAARLFLAWIIHER